MFIGTLFPEEYLQFTIFASLCTTSSFNRIIYDNWSIVFTVYYLHDIVPISWLYGPEIIGCTWVSSPRAEAGSWRSRSLRKSAVSDYMILLRPVGDCRRLIHFLQYRRVLVWAVKEQRVSKQIAKRGSAARIVARILRDAARRKAALQWFSRIFPGVHGKRSIRSERDEKEIACVRHDALSLHRCVWIAIKMSVRLSSGAMRQKVYCIFLARTDRLTLRLIINKTYHGQ